MSPFDYSNLLPFLWDFFKISVIWNFSFCHFFFHCFFFSVSWDLDCTIRLDGQNIRNSITSSSMNKWKEIHSYQTNFKI